MTRKPLVRQLLLGHLLVVALALSAAGWFASKWIEETYTDSQKDRLRSAARLLASGAGPALTGTATDLERASAGVGQTMGVRVTLIQTDGRVIFDTDEGPGESRQPRGAPRSEGSAGRPRGELAAL